MNVSFDARISASNNLLISNVADELVILNCNNETYYGLNKTGSRMWNSLTTSDSIESTYKVLLTEFEVDKYTLQRDLFILVEQLFEQGLVKVAEV